jgi:hypothetical protein
MEVFSPVTGRPSGAVSGFSDVFLAAIPGRKNCYALLITHS